uniref:Potassium/proton antiporter CemA n=1 Tax=Chlorogonium capillatum TaxID=71743 RepID=A0A0S2ICY5_9CHLO|nr:chloroplast enveloppe membrane protein [Chlorogonium capillatum]
MSSINKSLIRNKASEPDNKQEVVSITYEEIGLFPRSFSRVLDRFLKQVFSDVENLVIQEYRFYRYLFLTTLKCLFILFFVPFFVNFLAKTYVVRPLTEYFWNTKQPEIFLNSYQQKHAFAELKDFEEKLYFESLIYPKTAFIPSLSEGLFLASHPASTCQQLPAGGPSLGAPKECSTSSTSQQSFGAPPSLTTEGGQRLHTNITQAKPLPAEGGLGGGLEGGTLRAGLEGGGLGRSLAAEGGQQPRSEGEEKYFKGVLERHKKLKEEPLVLGITESSIVSLPGGHKHGQELGYGQVQVSQAPLTPPKRETKKSLEANKLELASEGTRIFQSRALEEGTLLTKGEKIIGNGKPQSKDPPAGFARTGSKTEGENVQTVDSPVSGKAYKALSEQLGGEALFSAASRQVKPGHLYPSGGQLPPFDGLVVKNLNSERQNLQNFMHLALREEGQKQKNDQNAIENNRVPYTAFVTPYPSKAWVTKAGTLRAGVYSDEKTESLINAYTLKSSLFVYQTIEADKNIQQRYQEKTIELAQRYNDQSIEEITNFFADLISLFTLFYLLYALEIQINITKSFLLEVFFGLDDSKKSLLILLVTDLLVGYHSSNLWELFFEFIFHHYGLPESQTGIFLLVATLPVLLDVLFKYLIFRHLNRSSPATVATYHAMIE